MKKSLFLLFICTLLFSSCSKKEEEKKDFSENNSYIIEEKKELTKEDLEKETISSLIKLLSEKDDYVIFYLSDKDNHGLKASFLVLDEGKWKCGGESFAGSPSIIEECYDNDKVGVYYTFYAKAQENVNDKFVTVLGYEASYKTIITKEDIINIILGNNVKDTYDAIFIDEENENEVFVSDKNKTLSAIVIKDDCPITKVKNGNEEISKLSKGEELKVKSRSKKTIEEEGEPLLTCLYLLDRDDGLTGYVKSSNIRLYDSEELHNKIKDAYNIE